MRNRERQIFEYFQNRLEKDKLIILNGARQVGKTTLCRQILPHMLGKNFFYASFDDPDERIRFRENAILILENIREEIIVLD